jgi:hypothetical protein
MIGETSKIAEKRSKINKKNKSYDEFIVFNEYIKIITIKNI